jgi:HEAT repeat protein/beta-lactamase regulating signal transducer with metallopeptidase domain
MNFLSLPIVADAVIKASLILAATALAAAALRRASASARHLVWTFGLLSALAIPALSLALPRWELPIVTIAPAVRAGTGPLQAPSRPAPELGRAGRESAAETSIAGVAESPAPPASSAPLSWSAIVFLAWIAGAAAIVGRMLLGLAAVQWMSRRLPDVDAAPWLDEAQALAWMLEIGRVRFLRGAAGTMPMAWGIVRPSVVMPADADTWPAHRLRVVLLHELAHVKRRDCLTHLVAQMACAAYWFNPLAWMAARRLRAERERACDDLVLAAGTRGSDYADQLLDIARVMTGGRFPAVIGGASLAMAHRSQLEGRLIAILDPTVPRRGLTRARAAAAATVFALVAVPVASVQPWAESAVNAPIADAMQAQDAQARQQAQARQHAQQPQRQQQEAIQSQVQGTVQGAVQGAIQGVAQGVVQGVTQGVTQGVVQGAPRGAVQGGVEGGVAGGIAGGIAGGVARSVAGGVVGGIAEAVGGLADLDRLAIDEKKLDREKDKENKGRDQDGEKKGRGDPRAVAALLDALKDSDKEVRETAMQALVQMRDPRIFDPLVAALKDSSPDVREHAAFGLGQLRDARAIEPLAAIIKDSSPSVREQVVFALGQLRAAGAIDALTAAVRDASASVREQAVFALGQIRDRRSVEPLISALKDENASVREQAAFALGQIRDAKAVEALVVALKSDQNADVREHAAFALGQIGDARAIDGLTAALKDANAEVRRNAAFALGQIR